MKTILIDDNAGCLDLLSHLLTRHCPDVQVIEQFTNPLTALNWLHSNAVPDLIFSDAEMPAMPAVDWLHRFCSFSTQVIFTAADDKHAIRALRLGAMDYLLKPIDIFELKSAVERAILRGFDRQTIRLPNTPRRNPQPARVALSTATGVDFIAIADILYCSSEGSYTDVYLAGGSKIVLSKPLKELESLLPLDCFLRIHHSYTVNATHIKRYVRGAGGEVLMPNGKFLPVSRSKKEMLLYRLGLSG